MAGPQWESACRAEAVQGPARRDPSRGHVAGKTQPVYSLSCRHRGRRRHRPSALPQPRRLEAAGLGPRVCFPETHSWLLDSRSSCKGGCGQQELHGVSFRRTLSPAWGSTSALVTSPKPPSLGPHHGVRVAAQEVREGTDVQPPMRRETRTTGDCRCGLREPQPFGARCPVDVPRGPEWAPQRADPQGVLEQGPGHWGSVETRRQAPEWEGLRALPGGCVLGTGEGRL